MRYHPDRNLGNEKWAEEKFKDINEAYAVLGDEKRRWEYDRMKQANLAGYRARYTDRRYYSQEQVFSDTFTNPYLFQELARMFQEAGLRFDERFVNSMFFGGKGFSFVFSTEPGRGWQSTSHPPAEYKPPLLLRLVGKAMRFILRNMLGVESLPDQDRKGDLYHKIVLSRKEANAGIDRRIEYNRGKEKKRLVVKVPPGVTEGTRIRLRGMGIRGQRPGDLYIAVSIKD